MSQLGPWGEPSWHIARSRGWRRKKFCGNGSAAPAANGSRGGWGWMSRRCAAMCTQHRHWGSHPPAAKLRSLMSCSPRCWHPCERRPGARAERLGSAARPIASGYNSYSRKDCGCRSCASSCCAKAYKSPMRPYIGSPSLNSDSAARPRLCRSPTARRARNSRSAPKASSGACRARSAREAIPSAWARSWRMASA